jgi:hypothetical protein
MQIQDHPDLEDNMDRVFTLDAADGIPDGELRPPMQVWWGTFRGAMLGLMTAAHGPVPSGADPVVISHLGRVSALISCLAERDVAAVAGINPRRGLGLLSEELEPLAWDSDTVTVDGRAVSAATLAHRGLEFAAGADFITYPFLLIRLSGGAPPWPPLRTVPAPPWVA